VIQDRIEDALSDAILTGEFAEGETVLIDAEDNEFVLRPAEEKAEKREKRKEKGKTQESEGALALT
jgi:ATP-dependent Clp protease ATP-binding subunit ClpC